METNPVSQGSIPIGSDISDADMQSLLTGGSQQPNPPAIGESISDADMQKLMAPAKPSVAIGESITDEQMKALAPQPPAMPPAMPRSPSAELPPNAELPIPATGGGENAPLFDPRRGRYMAEMNKRQGGVAIDPNKVTTETPDAATQARMDKFLASVPPPKMEPSFNVPPPATGLGGPQATIGPQKPYEPTGFARAVSVFMLPLAKEYMMGQAEVPRGLEETLAPRTVGEKSLAMAGKFAGFIGPSMMAGSAAKLGASALSAGLGTMGPAALGGKISDLLTAPIMDLFNVEGSSVVNRLLARTIQGGTSLGLASAIADMKNPDGFFDRFGSGFKTGAIFGASSLMNAAEHPLLSQVARQFGGRVLMATAGQYADGFLKKENIPDFVFNELMNTYFLSKGEKPPNDLKNMTERKAAQVVMELNKQGNPDLPTEDVIAEIRATPGGARKIMSDFQDTLTTPAPEMQSYGTGGAVFSKDAMGKLTEATPVPPEPSGQANLPPTQGVPDVQATPLAQEPQKPVEGQIGAVPPAREAIPATTTAPKSPVEAIPEAERTPEQAKLIDYIQKNAAIIQDSPAFPTSGKEVATSAEQNPARKQQTYFTRQVENQGEGSSVRKFPVKDLRFGMPKVVPESWAEIYDATNGKMLKRPTDMRQEWNSRKSGIPEYYFRKDGVFPDDVAASLGNPNIKGDEDLRQYIIDNLARPKKTIEEQAQGEQREWSVQYAENMIQRGMTPGEPLPTEAIPELARYLSEAGKSNIDSAMVEEAIYRLTGKGVFRETDAGYELTPDNEFKLTQEQTPTTPAKPAVQPELFAPGEKAIDPWKMTAKDLDRKGGNPEAGKNSDIVNTELIGKIPVGTTFTWTDGRIATVTAVKSYPDGDSFETSISAGRYALPGTKGAETKVIKGHTLADLVRNGLNLQSLVKAESTTTTAKPRVPAFGEVAPRQLGLDETKQELRPALDAATPGQPIDRSIYAKEAIRVFDKLGIDSRVRGPMTIRVMQNFDPAKDTLSGYIQDMQRRDVGPDGEWRPVHRPEEVPIQENPQMANVAEQNPPNPATNYADAQKNTAIKARILKNITQAGSKNAERDTDIVHSFLSGQENQADIATKYGIKQADVSTIANKYKRLLSEDGTLKKLIRERGSIDPNLLTLGIPKFVEKDVIPTVKFAAETAIEAAVLVRDYLAPASAGKGATIAARTLGENLARKAMAGDRAIKATEKAWRMFDKLGPKEGIDFQMGMEERVPGEAVYHGVDPKMTKAGEIFTRLLDRKVAEVQQVNPDALQELIENYWPHQWKDPDKATSFYAEWFSRRPLEGSKAFLKKRSIPTMRDGIAAGLEPKFTNPADAIRFKLSEMDKYIMAHKTFDSMKDAGEMIFVRSGSKAPDGLNPINDKIATVYAPPDLQSKTEAGARIGTTILGHYYAPSDAARIINNYYSPGLRGNKAFSAYLTLGNVLNQAQLGLSAFHLGFTSMDAMISKMALAINQFYHADVGQGLKSLALVPTAPIENVLRGRLLKEEWMGGKPDYRSKATEAMGKGLDKFTEWVMPGAKGDMPKILESMLSAGGRARMDRLYATGFTSKMVKAFRDENLIGAGLRLPGAIIEQASKPIMEYLVPLQKMGVYSDLVRYELERMEKEGTYTEVEKQDMARKAWRSVDNRMGQFVYDNLHWNKFIKDVGMASVRSLGWNLGAGAEVLGGVKDIATKGFGNILKGKAPELTYRTSYVVAMTLMAGALGGLVHYLYNGKSPENILDWYFPRTGRLDEQGREERVSLPSYVKNVYEMITASGQMVKNKIHPAITSLIQLLQNKDFYGVEISDANLLSLKGLADRFVYTQKQLIPLSVRNIQKEKALGAPLSQQVAPFFGVVRAPASISMSPAERVMNKALSVNRNTEPIPQAQADTSAAERKFKSLIRQGTPLEQMPPDVMAQVKNLPDSKRRYLANDIAKSSFQSHFSRLTLADALATWDKSDPTTERPQVRQMMFNKISNAANNDPASFQKNREAIMKFVSQARSK